MVMSCVFSQCASFYNCMVSPYYFLCLMIIAWHYFLSISVTIMSRDLFVYTRYSQNLQFLLFVPLLAHTLVFTHYLMHMYMYILD